MATLLARMTPWVLEVSLRQRVYSRVSVLRTRGEWTKEAVAEIKEQERTVTNRQWSAILNRPEAPGVVTRDAVMPHFSAWLDRDFGSISFRLTQLITGHGCFGHYLYRMGKRDSPACLHCTCLDDTVAHTIFECPAWVDQRLELWNNLNINIEEEEEYINLGIIMGSVLESQNKWYAFSQFANSVISGKEVREREWEVESLSPAVSSPSPS
ncbi:unnamed protein product [Lasius platythorax]|uniref:Reverse transcriptase n=1 Tax=Lasius platythorax TaxID=488582 RepID=A0AAV2MWL1_9HYME